MSNIVEAQNRVLSNCFGVDCYVSKVSFEVDNMEGYGRIIPRSLTSNLVFQTNSKIQDASMEKQGCRLVSGECEYNGHGYVFSYRGVFFYRSNLRKKLLKVMLKYN